MKKIKFSLLLPLYAADALMFATVIAICWNNIIFGEIMELRSILACCGIVVAGMVLVSIPLFLEHRERMQKIKSSDDELKKLSDENFKIIFEDLQAIRAICADTDERIENDEYAIEKLALKINKESPLMRSVSAMEKQISEFENSLAETSERLSKVESSEKESLEKAKNLSFEIGEIKKNLEEVFEKTENKLRAEIEALGKNSENPKIAAETSEKIKLAETSISDLQKSSSEKFAEIFALIAALPKVREVEFSSSSKDSGMLSRALSNGEMAKNAVKKFINKDAGSSEDDASDEGEISEDGEYVEFSDEQTSSLEEDAAIFDNEEDDSEEDSDENLISEEDDFTEEDSETEVEEADFDDADEYEEDSQEEVSDAEEDDSQYEDAPEDEAETENESEDETEKDGDADFFNPADSEEKGISESEKENKELFEDLPETYKSPRKAKKGDTVVIVNSLIGIGNKPFLRGEGGGLNADKGLAMDFLEIGKWSWVAPSGGNLKFRVLKNDKTPPLEDAEYELEEGGHLEIDLMF